MGEVRYYYNGKYVDHEAAEKRLSDMVQRCLHPTPINSPVVAVHDIELPHIRIINDNEHIVRY